MSSSSTMTGATESNDLLEGLPRPIILGSGSFTRKRILKEMGIDFFVIKRPIDEREIGDRFQDSPHDLVLNLAQAKMNHLVQELEAGNCHELEELFPGRATELGSFIVLTGDQVVTHEGNIFEKPESIGEAKGFCKGYASSPPSTVGSCVLRHIPSGVQVSGVDSATIHFRPSIADDVDGKDLIDRLLEDKAPILECAGGLMIEHALVREHVDRIVGTEDSVMGLSKDLVVRLLNELRIKLDVCKTITS